MKETKDASKYIGSFPQEGKRSPPAPRAEGKDNLSELMGGIQGGSARAFQELMNLLWPELVRFAAWETGDPDEARDVVQEAFTYLWSRRRSWVRGGSPRSYLYRIVRHQILDQQRRREVRDSWLSRQRVLPRPGPPRPDEALAATRLEAAFCEALSSLSPRRREAFNLVVLRGFSHREAADVMEVSDQTVANQVSAALRQIREALGEVSDNVP